MSSRNKDSESFGYSAKFVETIERQHQDALHGITDKRLSLDRTHSRVTESLKKQLDTLRQQADLNAQTQLREANVLREAFEIKLQGISREQEGVERSLREKLAQVQSRAEEVRDRNSFLKQEELEERLRHEEEIGLLQGKTRDLLHEKAHLKTDVVEAGKLEIERLEQLHEDLKVRHAELIRSIRADFHEGMQSLRLKIEDTHRAIKRTEHELNECRREHNLIAETTERDLQQMQSHLREVRQGIEGKEQELYRVKTQHDDAVKEGMIFKKETALLTSEVNRVRRENLDLIEELRRLEKLVYGKGRNFPSPS
jgi:chromosome segregation ATPase